ncbi:MAG TPA: XrtA system polysaccharide chain length determinant [Burkholderiaceae bacterium]|nr:XrtA system polysaccharide chain length determinant [Burkholderiaceae bacterium]
MNQIVEQVLGTLRGMWRRRWYGLLGAWAVAVVGAVVVSRIPDRFEAEARVFVDTKSVLRPLMRDLAVEPDLDQTIGMLGRTLITRPNVETLINKAQLLPAGAPQADRDALVDALLRSIKVAAVGRDNVFAFTYRDTAPETARRVVQDLVALFVEADLGSKQRDVESARSFIEEQVRQYEARLTEAEGRLKDFKLRNLGTVGGQGGDYFARISTLRDEVTKQSMDLRAAEQARDSLKNELSGESMTLVDQEPPPVGQSNSEYDARLDAQRRQLDELLRRYTEAHPDVIASRRLIARLEEQRQQDIEAQRKAAASKPPKSSKGTTEVMQRVKLALAEAEANVASMRVRLGETQARLAQMTAAASRVPQIDAELAQLNRDYDIVRRQYEAMVAKREKAALSEDIDATRLAQFRVIDPPRVSPNPVFPNRTLLLVAALIVALAAGVAAAFIVSQLIPTFDTLTALRQVTQRPVLGSVSRLIDPIAIGRAKRNSMMFGAALGALFLIYGAWLARIAMLSRV